MIDYILVGCLTFVATFACITAVRFWGALQGCTCGAKENAGL